MAPPPLLLTLALAGSLAPAPLAPTETSVEILVVGTASRQADMVNLAVNVEIRPDRGRGQIDRDGPGPAHRRRGPRRGRGRSGYQGQRRRRLLL